MKNILKIFATVYMYAVYTAVILSITPLLFDYFDLVSDSNSVMNVLYSISTLLQLLVIIFSPTLYLWFKYGYIKSLTVKIFVVIVILTFTFGQAIDYIVSTAYLNLYLEAGKVPTKP